MHLHYSPKCFVSQIIRHALPISIGGASFEVQSSEMTQLGLQSDVKKPCCSYNFKDILMTLIVCTLSIKISNIVVF